MVLGNREENSETDKIEVWRSVWGEIRQIKRLYSILKTMKNGKECTAKLLRNKKGKIIDDEKERDKRNISNKL